jgi:hypothetical protein
MSLLERIAQSVLLFNTWPADRKETALKEARVSASYGVRMHNILKEETDDR